MWQDYVFTIGQIAIVGSQWITIKHPTHKPPIATCAVNMTIMFAFALTFGTLGLYFSMLPAGVLGIGWLIILKQRKQLNFAES